MKRYSNDITDTAALVILAILMFVLYVLAGGFILMTFVNIFNVDIAYWDSVLAYILLRFLILDISLGKTNGN